MQLLCWASDNFFPYINRTNSMSNPNYPYIFPLVHHSISTDIPWKYQTLISFWYWGFQFYILIGNSVAIISTIITVTLVPSIPVAFIGFRIMYSILVPIYFFFLVYFPLYKGSTVFNDRIKIKLQFWLVIILYGWIWIFNLQSIMYYWCTHHICSSLSRRREWCYSCIQVIYHFISWNTSFCFSFYTFVAFCWSYLLEYLV